MEIAFHSMIHILVTCLLVYSTSGDVIVQPGSGQFGQIFQSGQQRNFNSISTNPHQLGIGSFGPNYHLMEYPYNQLNNYRHFVQPAQPRLFVQPEPIVQSGPFVPSTQPQSLEQNLQSVQSGSVGPPVQLMPSGQFMQPSQLANFAPNQNQLSIRSLNEEFQKNKELHQKVYAQINGLLQHNTPQQEVQAVNPAPPGTNFLTISNLPSQYLPYAYARPYRSLPIFHSQGYQIMKLADLQNERQNAWSSTISTGYNSGVNSQTFNSSLHTVAANSSVDTTQFDLNTSDLNKRVDDHIVGSPLQIYTPPLLFTEQHHPVEIVNIQDNFEVSNISKNDNNTNVVKNSKNFSTTVDQIISHSSNKDIELSDQFNRSMKQNYFANNFNKSKNLIYEAKLENNKQFTKQDYLKTSGSKIDDKLTSNYQYFDLDKARNYNQPESHKLEGLQRNVIPQVNLNNSPASKSVAMSDYRITSNNKPNFSIYNGYNNYNNPLGAIRKSPLLWQFVDVPNNKYNPYWHLYKSQFYNSNINNNNGNNMNNNNNFGRGRLY